MDASILLTANVPSAKKIIVHGPQGPDEGGIPSQFPIGEDVQFCQVAIPYNLFTLSLMLC